MEYLFLRFAFLASCLTLHAGTTLRLADRIQGQCLTDTLKIKIAPEFLEAHNITLSAKDKNGVAHSLGSSLDAKCGYKQRRNSRGGLEVSASLMACHVYLKQRQQQEARLVFTVGVSYAPRDGSGPGATESFSFSCPRRPGRARRRVLCEEDYIEVSLNIDVPFHHSMDKQARSQESPWYFTVQYPDGSIVTRDQAWIWNQGIGLNVEHFDGWIAFRVPQSSPLIIREDHQGYQSLGFKVVAKHEELLIGLRYDLSAVCPVVQVRCEGSNVSVSAANLRLPARGAPTEDLGLLLQLDGVSLSPQDAASRGYALQLGDSEIRASFAVRDNPLVPGGPSVMNRHQLSLVHMWRDGADQRNNKVVIHVPGHTCPSPPAQPAFSVTIRTEGFNITYGPVPGDYVLTSISLDGVLFQSVQDLPRGVGVRLVRRDRLLFVFVTVRFGSRLLPRKYAGGFTSLYSTSPALLFKSPDLREVIAEEKETYTHLREDIVLPVLEGFCRNSSVCFNVTRGNADLFWSFYIWDTPFQAKRAAERGQSYASYRAHLTFCVDVRSPDLLHQGVSQDRRLLLLAVSFRDRAKGGVMATARQACPFRPAGELECTADGLLKATGLRLAASPLASLDRLTLRDPSCSPSEISDGKVSFSFPVYACGTLRKVHGTHVEYENRISNENALPKDAPEYLKFQSTLVCRYSEENTLPVGPSAAPPPGPAQPARGHGNLTLRMDIMRDATFSSAFLPEEFPVVRRLREPLFLEVQMESEDPELELFLRDCWGSPDPQLEPKPPLTWPVVKDSCELKGDEYQTVFHRVRRSGRVRFPRHHKRLEVKTFAFVGPSSRQLLKQQISFHCSVIICDTTALRTDDACRGDCIPHKQRKGRSSGSGATRETLVSSGSILLLPQVTLASSVLDPWSSPWWLVMPMAAALFSLAFLVYMCWTLKLKNANKAT
ncbi:uncharacterized protein [Lepisosteus oculatus]|uniref:uncharacterized protein isoform X2 n=1 Tax=Lepisosteus oculatus TaxID=7918 RepID=UPI0035F506DB